MNSLKCLCSFTEGPSILLLDLEQQIQALLWAQRGVVFAIRGCGLLVAVEHPDGTVVHQEHGSGTGAPMPRNTDADADADADAVQAQA
jgi:hypothetical protein